MKKILLCFLMLTIVMITFSQQVTPSLTLTKQDYLLKSKHQQTAAVVILGGGVLIGGIGVIVATRGVIPLPFPTAPNEQQINNGGTLMAIGTVAALGSIPLFIASSRNKKKALSLSFKNEKMMQLNKSSLVYKDLPSIHLKIQL